LIACGARQRFDALKASVSAQAPAFEGAHDLPAHLARELDRIDLHPARKHRLTAP
jgi:hypothetical protein